MGSYSTAVATGSYSLSEAVQELDEVIVNSFMVNSFADFYDVINGQYKAFEFTDKLLDNDRIEEYKYIYEQLLKYIFKNQDNVLNQEKDYDKMLKAVMSLREKTYTSTKERKILVYQKLRNDWLDNLLNNLTDMLSLQQQLKTRGGE